MPAAFLCGLGRMGRRHLVGLVQSGRDVLACDPSPAARAAAREVLQAAELPTERLAAGEDWPAQRTFDVAVFAETAPTRHADLALFLERGNRAGRTLLEKPLTCDPRLLEDLPSLLARHGTRAETVRIHLPYRSSAFYRRLSELASDSKELVVSFVGGAVGLGCNGIHYLDMFDAIAGEGEDDIVWARLSPSPVPSSRGAELRDFGGDFTVRRGRATLFISLPAESSAATLSAVRGDHFAAWLDENDQSYRVYRRDPRSRKPSHLYGQDYRLEAQGTFPAVRFEETTRAWAQGELDFPSLDVGLRLQRLVFRLLEAGGAAPPYSFS